MHEHRLLQDDRPAVADFGDEMHRGPRHLHPALQHRFVDMEPVVALAAEGGNQGRMDVHHFVRERTADHFIHNSHESGVHHQIRLLLLQSLEQSRRKGLGIGKLLPVDHPAGDVGFGGTL